MSLISKVYTFISGATIVAGQHNKNFDDIYNDYNGNITNANISASAAIDYTKVNGLSNVLKRTLILKAFGDTESVITGNGKVYCTIPAEFNGMNLTAVGLACYTTSSSGLPNVTIERGRRATASSAPTYADMLSTALTIDVGEYDSVNATTAAVIDTTKDDVLTADIVRINVDGAGVGVQGLEARLTFQTP